MNAPTIAIAIVISISVLTSFLLRGENSWSLMSKGTRDFIHPVVAALSIFASLNGGFMVLGLVQVGYEGGLTGYIMGLAYILGSFLLIFLFTKKRSLCEAKDGSFGLDSLLLSRYGSKTLKAFYFITGIVFAGVLGQQLLAIVQYLKIYKDPFNFVVIVGIGVVGTVIYTILHGFRGVLKNDIIQSILELGVAIIFSFTILKYLSSKVDHINFNPGVSGLGGKYMSWFPFAACFFLTLSYSARADLWQRIMIVKDKYKKVTILASSALLSIYFFLMTSAGILIKQNVDQFDINSETNLSGLTISVSNQIIPGLTSSTFFNETLLVLVLGGILIAIFSSLDSYLSLTSLSLTRFALWSSIPKIRDKDMSNVEEKTLIANARVATITLAIIGGIFAVIIPDIIDLMAASFSVIGVLVPIMLYGFLGKIKPSDLTGSLPIWISLVVLLICLPILKTYAFLPSILLGITIWSFLLIRDIKRYKMQKTSTTN